MNSSSASPAVSEPNKVKILILCNESKEGVGVANSDNVLDLINSLKSTDMKAKVTGLVNQLNRDRINYQIEFAKESSESKKDDSSNRSALKINEGNYDVVLMSDDLKSSPWKIIELCSKNKTETGGRPRFYIDGKVENILDREFKHSNFSGAVSVVKKDSKEKENSFEFKTAYQYANANPECKIPNEYKRTKFNIASITKMFTSIAIAKMIEEKKLDYDVPIRDSLSKTNCDRFYKDIFKNFSFTPRELLNHTAGIDDGIGKVFEGFLGPKMMSFATVKDYVSHFTSLDKQLLTSRCRHQYSNYGFDLLGLAIEALTGNYYDYLQKNVFDSAGMKSTTPQRNSGVEFAVPSVQLFPLPIEPSLVELMEDKSNPELQKLAIQANRFLQYSQEHAAQCKPIEELVKNYQIGLAKCTAETFPSFKQNIINQITSLYTRLVRHDDQARKIESIGHPLMKKIRQMEEKNPNDPLLLPMKKIDALLYQTHRYLSQQSEVFNLLFNSLSIARPAGASMYSTVEDMLAFDHALNGGTLSQYKSHLTEHSVEEPHGPPGHQYRYGFGCGIRGQPNNPQYSLGHGGDAPGTHADYRMYPNAGYSVVALTNNDEDLHYMARLIERNLIFANTRIRYFDSRINPNSSAELLSDIALAAAFPQRNIASIAAVVHPNVTSSKEDRNKSSVSQNLASTASLIASGIGSPKVASSIADTPPSSPAITTKDNKNHETTCKNKAKEEHIQSEDNCLKKGFRQN